MIGPDPTFHWSRWIGDALMLAGGLLAMAIVGVLSAASYLWSWLAGRRDRTDKCHRAHSSDSTMTDARCGDLPPR